VHAVTRLVLDTNVWLDWLVFDDAGIVPIQAAITRGAACVFLSPACELELVRVLGYPLSGRKLSVAAQAAALALCRAIARMLEPDTLRHAIAALPRCADPDDQMFLELARDCRADLLITKDRDLLAIATRKVTPLPFDIITPRAFAHGQWV
jgi:putative PIN family toxin of toxin-antitoxin system